ncbi:hypothetical protein D0U04_25465 [Bacillus clarus]|uniref:Uncharacterized protein n=1 Tax=Bacillus clarus TaxID=2338372 RepID=A0A090YZX5_9BACI|nr:hypothetical protein [Bacillus clarus]KFN04524.1 hypothetical protein DJ93_5269 [Bacillus clarus]RFT63266.1 hypothetical protein D0U04_25465 [Bacillus clarus]
MTRNHNQDCHCCQTNVCKLLKNLDPFSKVVSITINGVETQVSHFAKFNSKTGIAAFSKDDGEILLVDCTKIDAILLGNLCECSANAFISFDNSYFIAEICLSCLPGHSRFIFSSEFDNSHIFFESITASSPFCTEFQDPLSRGKAVEITGIGKSSSEEEPIPYKLELLELTITEGTVYIAAITLFYPDTTKNLVIHTTEQNAFTISSCLNFKKENKITEFNLEMTNEIIQTKLQKYNTLLTVQKFDKAGKLESSIEKNFL